MLSDFVFRNFLFLICLLQYFCRSLSFLYITPFIQVKYITADYLKRRSNWRCQRYISRQQYKKFHFSNTLILFSL